MLQNNKLVSREAPVGTTRVTVTVPAAFAGVTELRAVKHPAVKLLEAFAKAAERR